MLLALLRQYVRPYRWLLTVVAVLQVISTLASLYLPTVNAAIIDDGVAKGDTQTIVELGGVMLAVTGLQVVCAVGAVYFGSRAAMGFGRDLRSAIFHHVTGFSAAETARFGAPSLLTRTTNDVQQIQLLVQLTCTMLITAPIMSIGGIFMAIHQDAGLAWLLLVSVPVLAIANYWVVSHLLPIFRSMQRLIDGINRVMREQLSGIRVIRAFAREPFERNRFAEANQALSDTALTAGRWQALMLPVTTLVINVSSVALIWFGGLRIDDGQMQVGSLIAFLSYFMQILMAVLLATFILILVPRASACGERITEVLATEPVITSPANPVRPPTVNGAIRLRDATFRYPGADRPVLQDVSLTAEPGTTTAIVGSTGSGKSTLVSLICRMYDVTAGSVRVDDVDVRDYDTEQLWSAIGLVPQRGYLFSGTVADNLRYGKADATDDEMWDALRVASADGFVRAHADGLGMPVSQGGINFSGGQRQRLAIARAVIRRPAIYLFDDAFSALDVHTDARVRSALSEVSADSTVIIVAQRISTVAAAEQIIVIDDGEVVGTGTHESLLADCPTYAEFADSQTIGAGVGGQAMTAPLGRPIRGMVQAPTERSRDFKGSAIRLVKRLTPQRGPTAAVILLGVGGIAIGVIGPRILGHATDLLFNGVIGRQLPAGLTKEQAIEAARARGDNTFADLLSGMNAIPGRGVDFGAVGRTLLLALALYLVAALLVWLQARLLNVVVQRTMVALRSDVEDKLHRLPLSYFDARQRGEVLSRVTNDIDNISTSLSMTISQLLTSLLTVVAVLVMMLTISPLLTLLTVVTLPLSLFVTREIARRSQRLFVAQWANTGRLNAHIEETYSGFTLVKTFGHRAYAEDQFREFNGDVYHSSFGAQFFSGLVGPATTFIGNLSYVAVAVVGGVHVATGQITLGSIQAFIQYVRQFNQPLTQVAGMYNTLQSGMASAERVFDLLDAEEEAPDEPVALPSPDGQRGRVEFENVSFAYRPGTPVIEELSLVAQPCSTVAIVGPTGAGKTTLVNLLMRFYDVDSGRILVDGVDIATVSRESLRSRIGMVLQDTWLFGGTIYDNIAYGRPDADEDDVIEAAKAAYVDRFVHTLPDGYDTWVSDDGGNISAGEKQLITIARAFLARPQLLILDEATSSVDTRTELLIQHAMVELRRDRTSFIIAHRLSTIRDADQILVMDEGRIVERGSHAELLARRGEYWAMAQV